MAAPTMTAARFPVSLSVGSLVFLSAAVGTLPPIEIVEVVVPVDEDGQLVRSASMTNWGRSFM